MTYESHRTGQISYCNFLAKVVRSDHAYQNV